MYRERDVCICIYIYIHMYKDILQPPLLKSALTKDQ